MNYTKLNLNMEIIKEKEIKDKPMAISFECNEIIMEQMKKK